MCELGVGRNHTGLMLTFPLKFLREPFKLQLTSIFDPLPVTSTGKIQKYVSREKVNELDKQVIDSKAIRRILSEYQRIAVVGLSSNDMRPSYFATKYLQDHGYKIVPVNPRYQEVLGEKCYPDLNSIPGKVEVVNLFQRPERVPWFVDQAIDIGAKVVWMQLGIVHEGAARKAREAGLEVVMDRCMKIEYARLSGGLN